MRRLRDLALERKLALVVLATCAGALVIACAALAAFETVEFRRTLVRDATVLAEILGRNTQAALMFRDPDTAAETLRAVDAEPKILSAALYDEGGEAFAEYARSGSATVLPLHPAPTGHRFADGYLVVSHPVRLDERRIGTILLRVADSEIYERLRGFAGIAAMVLLGSLAAALVLSTRLQRSVSRPILALADTARAIADERDFSVRAVKESEDEVGTLTDAFNAMLLGIEEREEALRGANDSLRSEIAVREHAEERVQAQLARHQLLNEITRAIGERQDLGSVFQVVVRTLEDDLPVDLACVCAYDSADGTLSVSAVGGGDDAPVERLGLAAGSTTVDAVASGLARCLSGQLVYEPDTAEIRLPLPERFAREGFRSLVIAPLLVESAVFGILFAARRRPNAFSSGECEFLRQLSEHVALAAHHVRLYEALEGAYNDLHQTQQAIMQQERLRALGEMASGIAHDINNAISPVALYTESLLEQEPNLSEKTRDYLVTIQHAAEDVAQTVSRMREFYRHREPQMSFTAVALNRVVEQVVDMTRARWGDIPQQRGVVIDLRKELADGSPTVMGVESEIREALTNLIFNAVDSMPEGGTLTLRTLEDADAGGKGASGASPRAAVEIADTGIGMDEPTRERCIEPFFTTKGERGTGLGMAMVYGTAQRHGADLEIDSAVGRGTTVRLVFDSASVGGATAPDAVTLRPPSRLRLLVVDDDPLLIKSLRDTLTADGHDVTVASGGQAGIDAFRAAHTRQRCFAAVITDLGMPHVDGRRVAEAIKTTSSSTPVIMLTGWGQRLVAEGDIPPHVDRILNKPPKLSELRAALAALRALEPLNRRPSRLRCKPSRNRQRASSSWTTRWRR